jgi:outer membrane PBP1 activator LpoA protein
LSIPDFNLSQKEKDVLFRLHAIEARINAVSQEMQASILLNDIPELEKQREKIMSLFEARVDLQIQHWQTVRGKL